MALLSDYTAGTATVAGTTVTGMGTGWQAATFQEGDIFIADGWWAVVASVTSNTVLELVDWAGPALTDSAYRLRYMSDGSRASAQARQLIDMLGGTGNVEAFAGLAGVADTLPYFTGAGTMDVTALTAFARTFLAGANAAGAYGTLGAVPNAQLPARLREEAQFVTDWNTATSAGFYSCDNTALNQPPVAGYYVGIVWSRGTSVVYQDLIDAGGVAADSKTWRRKFGGGIWGAWYRLRLSEDEQKALYLPRANHTGIIPNDGLPLQRREKYWDNPVTNWNNATLSGQYSSINTATNAPYASWWIADVLNTDGVLIVQRARDITAIAAGNTATYERVRRAGVWGAWYLLRTSESEINAMLRLRTGTAFINATGWQTTSTSMQQSTSFSFNAKALPTQSPTSSLKFDFVLQVENANGGAAGSTGIIVEMRRYNGTAYVATNTPQMLFFDTQAGASQIFRGQLQISGVLTAAERRSDIAGNWTLAPYFQNVYAGNTAKILSISGTMLEFEP